MYKIMYTYPFNFCQCLYMCATYLCVSPCEINDGIVYLHLCLCVSCISICVPLYNLTFHLNEKFDCGKINLVLFVISIINSNYVGCLAKAGEGVGD